MQCMDLELNEPNAIQQSQSALLCHGMLLALNDDLIQLQLFGP